MEGSVLGTGDIAWMITATALVLFMVPGLALFYGGMVNTKNVVNMLMMNVVTIPIATIIWVIVGFSLAFGASAGGLGLIGDLSKVGLDGLTSDETLFASFQMMFAIITPALIAGAVAGRMKFSSWVIFAALWSLLIYPIVAHWGFAGDGLLFAWGARDFAGGYVIHINSGIAALALIRVLGPRADFGTEHPPHSLPITLIGTGLLWFGWFGFNAGSALAADGAAITALLNTQVGAALGAFGWMVSDWVRHRRPTLLGLVSGAVAGLVAITPAAGFVSPSAAIVIGVVGGYVCSLVVGLKEKFGYDDSLDVVGIHMVGGIIGSVLTGVFSSAAYGGFNGLIYGGAGFFAKQIVAVLAVVAFSFCATWVLAKILDKTIGLRTSAEEEMIGLDISQHGEDAYWIR
jgi:Amt family ammonium transporter